MDHLYAKVKRLQKQPYRKVVSDQRIFEETMPSVSSCVDYDPNTLLDDGEWFKVSGFSEQDYFPTALTSLRTSADIPELEKNQFLEISSLVAVQEGDFFFQRVRPASILRKKAIVFGDVVKLEKARSRIALNQYPDAIYRTEDNALLFRDLSAVSPLFQGIDLLFKTATEAQVAEFLDMSFVATDLPAVKVSKPNRKRIALALETLGKMSDIDRDGIFAYLSDYTDENLAFDPATGTFKIETDDELKVLLFGIEQRYYTTAVGSEKRLANSIVKLPA